MLLIDELSAIRHNTEGYEDMSGLLANFVQQDGCALLYSTHLRSTADLLRGRHPGGLHILELSGENMNGRRSLEFRQSSAYKV